MKFILLSFAAVLITASTSLASAIQFTTGGGRGHMFVTNSGSRVAATSLVRVGYLTTANDLSTFQDFATTTISNPGNTVALQVGGFLTNPGSSATVATAAKGAQIYLWVYNSGAANTATQAAIFTSADASWKIPSGFTGDPAETSNLSLALAEGIVALADPNLGGTPSIARGPIDLSGQAPTGNIFRLDGVPEPTSVVLSLGAFALFAGRRRRN